MSGGEITRSEMIPRGSVDLEVVKLMAYGRELDFMSPGMTCRAYLRGDFSPLREGTFIGGLGAPAN